MTIWTTKNIPNRHDVVKSEDVIYFHCVRLTPSRSEFNGTFVIGNLGLAYPPWQNKAVFQHLHNLSFSKTFTSTLGLDSLGLTHLRQSTPENLTKLTRILLIIASLQEIFNDYQANDEYEDT